MVFEDKVRKELKGLDNKQLCKFAWLCGVRALPFLSLERGFAYWNKWDRQKHLYSIFYALDVSRFAAADFTAAARASASAAYASDTAAAYASASAAIRAAARAAAARAAIADSTAASAAAARATVADSTTAARASASAARASAAAATVAAAYAYASVAAEKYDFNEILREDIKAIKENRLSECKHDTDIYGEDGELWNNFQKDLKAIGCDYWAELYKKLFNEGFYKFDEEELERRLVRVPDEIKDEGAAAVGRYLERLGEKVERLNEARIIILGEKGAGKTSLAKRLLDIEAPMPDKKDSTEGVDTSIWQFSSKDGKNVNAHVWDFAGHSITHSAHRCFMSARCLYIYVYNGRIERNNDPTYWLEQIRIHGGDSPILFLINEKDGHKADIAERTLKKDYPSVVDYYPVDIGSEDKTKLEEFRQTVMDAVRNNPSWNNQVVSEEAYKIKNELRERFDKEKEPHITREQFDKIAENCGAQTERIKGILDDLHTLGICLWYNKEEMEDFNTLVLNPDWITNGIYKVINEGFKEKKHILSVDMGTEILKNDEKYKYPREKVAYLFKLMRLYELAFFKNTENIFIPGILPIDSPINDNDILLTFDDAKDHLMMSFVVQKVLPPNIVARIIVQRHEDIFDEDLLWRKGAVLKHKGSDTTALIIEDERSVTVQVRGTNKTDYITSLRETIKAIFEDYKVIKSDLLYEVLLSENLSALMLPEKTIQSHAETGELYLDPNTLQKHSLKYAAQVYNITNIYASNVTLTEAESIGKIQNVGEGKIQEEIFNFHDCTINIQNIQGELNSLARSLQKGKQEPDDDANELELAAEEMEEVQKLIPANNNEISDEVKAKINKKGLLNRLKGIYKDLNDENSELYKKVSKVKRGIETAQNIVEQIKNVTQLLGQFQGIAS